jgi:uncharacterized protein YcaQ
LTSVRTLSRAEAARIAVRAQLLTADRPGDIIETVQSLTVLPIDPTAAIAPSVDLILWSRIGWPYEPPDFRRLFREDRQIFEWNGFFRPMSDLPLFLPLMRKGPEVGVRPRLGGRQRPVPPRHPDAASG